MEPVAPWVRWRITGALFFAQAFYSAAGIASFTVASIIGAHLGGSAVFAGVPAAMLYVGRGMSAYPIGIIMDRAGRRPAIALAYSVGALGGALATLSVLVESYALFVVAALIFGMARGGSDQSRFAAAEVHAEGRRARVIGLIVFSGTVGAIAGPLLVSLSEQFTVAMDINWLAGPWMVAAAFSLLSSSIILGLVRPDPLQILRSSDRSLRPASGAPARRGRGHVVMGIIRSPKARLAISSMMIGQVVMAMIMTMTPLYMNEGGQGTSAISFAMLSHTVGMFGLAWMTGWLVDRFSPIPIMVAGAFMLITTGLLAAIADDFAVTMAVMFLLGLGWNFTFVSGSSLLVQGLAPSERGRTQGIGDAFVSATAATGGLSSGLVFAWGGMELLGWMGLALAAALVAGAFWVGVGRQPLAAAADGS